MRPLQLVSLLDELAVAPENWGLHLYGQRAGTPTFWSYPSLHAITLNAAARYAAAGVGVNSRVVLPIETSIESVAALLALSCLGALPLCIKPPGSGATSDASARFVERIAISHDARFLLDSPSTAGLRIPLSRLPLPQLDTSAPRGPTKYAVQPGSVAFVQFSSGSTSSPKGVPITHQNLCKQLELLTTFDRREPGDVGASWLPLFHDMGLIGGLLSSLYAKGNLHLWSPRQFLSDPLAWLDRVALLSVSSFAIPNFAIEYLLRALSSAEEEITAHWHFGALRHVFVGAEPINPTSFAQFSSFLTDRGMRPEALQPAYGMAEAVLIATGGRDAPARVVTAPNGVRCVSVGKPLPGFELRVEASQSREASEREVGEILLRGGSLAHEYFEHDSELLDAQGYYHTGDIGFIDASELFVLGRTGDRLKINGESFFAHDFERVIEAVPGVAARSCVVLQRASRLYALVEWSRASYRAELRQLVSDAVLDELGLKIAVADVVPIARGQIRRTSSGKMKRAEMAALFGAGEIAVLESAADHDSAACSSTNVDT